jgi:hypothetical protein
MACCALAVFILGQLYMAIEGLARAMGFSPTVTTENLAADWYLGAEPTAPPMMLVGWRLPSFSARVATAAVLSAAALTTAFIYRPHIDRFDLAAYLADPAHICGALFSVRN